MAYRALDPTAFEKVRSHPKWSVRECARKLGVSIGVVSRWRRLIARDKAPLAPGRPRLTDQKRLQNRLDLMARDPLESLARTLRGVVSRVKRTGQSLTLEQKQDLQIMLWQTTYDVERGPDGTHHGIEVDVDELVTKALGPLGTPFVDRLVKTTTSHREASARGDDDDGDGERR
jgi:hypothetical protein